MKNPDCEYIHNQMRLTDVTQGSGNYVLKSAHIIEQNQKKEAAELIGSVFLTLREMGLSDKEIMNLVNLQYLSAASSRSVGNFSPAGSAPERISR